MAFGVFDTGREQPSRQNAESFLDSIGIDWEHVGGHWQKVALALAASAVIVGVTRHERQVYENPIFINLDPSEVTQLVVFGDSIPAGVKLRRGAEEIVTQRYGGYAIHLAEEVNTRAKNEGVADHDILVLDTAHELAVSGQTSAHVLARLRQHFATHGFGNGGPVLFCGSIGANDIMDVWRRRGAAEGANTVGGMIRAFIACQREYAKNCRAIFDLLAKVPNAQILMLSIPDPSNTPAVKGFVAELCRDNEAAQRAVLGLIKLSVAVFNFPLKHLCHHRGIAYHTLPEYDASMVSSIDGFHPSPEGHRQIGILTAKQKVVLHVAA